MSFRNIWIVPMEGPPSSPVTLLPAGSVWKYLDNGSNQSTNWSQTNFNDSAWASGPAMLGYGDANGVFPRTTNSYGPNVNNKYITTYYRRLFSVSNTWGLSHLTARLQRDDGAIGYLNGAEVFRSNMPTGSISYTTLASSTVNTSNETRFFLIPVDPAPLQAGTNLLAVEIHQSSTNSSDIAFDLALQADQLQTPRLDIALASDEVQLSWPGYAEGLKLYFATNLTLPASWNPVAKVPNLDNGQFSVTLSVVTNGLRFYRLQFP